MLLHSGERPSRCTRCEPCFCVLLLLQKAVVILRAIVTSILAICVLYWVYVCCYCCFIAGMVKFFLSGIRMCTAARSHCSVICENFADYALVWQSISECIGVKTLFNAFMVLNMLVLLMLLHSRVICI